MESSIPILFGVLVILLIIGGHLVSQKSIRIYKTQKPYKPYNPREHFKNKEPRSPDNPFKFPLGMTRYRSVADGECCDVWPTGPIVLATCNRVPVFPIGMTPFRDVPDEAKITEYPFDDLAPKDGKFTFVIPELKYDGIWSRRDDPDNGSRCCWSLEKSGNLKTYGNNKLSPIPKLSMFGKTIVQPPECAGLWPKSDPPITLVYDCKQNIPCSVSR